MNCRACNAPLTPMLTQYEDGIPVCYLCYNIHHGNINKEKLDEKLDGRDFMDEMGNRFRDGEGMAGK